MNLDVLQTAARLTTERQPFAMATVVRVEGSSSAPCGSKAIIDDRGRLVCGWIGGGCAEGAVRRSALEAIEAGAPLTITIDMTDELLGVGMPCGGVMDVFIEPMLPRPGLVILGHGRIAEALAAMGALLRFRVTLHDPSVDLDIGHSGMGPDTYVVIATQHKGDHQLLRRALASGAPYIALIASRHRARLVLEDLDHPDRVHSPAGLDIGAATPEEIALSVMSEIVALRRGAPSTALRDKNIFSCDLP